LTSHLIFLLAQRFVGALQDVKGVKEREACKQMENGVPFLFYKLLHLSVVRKIYFWHKKYDYAFYNL
jgi:hypothetical protein